MVFLIIMLQLPASINVRKWTHRVKNEEAWQRAKEERNALHTIERKRNWTGHIFLGTIFTLLKERQNGREEEGEYVSSYWVTLR